LFDESFVVVWDPTLVFEKDRLFATEGFKLIDDVEILENISSLATSSGGFSAVDVVDDSDAIDGDVEGLEVAARDANYDDEEGLKVTITRTRSTKI
jgi:hypothetical protein